ncbi:hypothetical protein HID58_002770 [Brassica napus]|uniref:TF-B3 domain-containing protein n=1 Tax=Brassica napus TaxID=3708 RepID=A0ABQ8EQY6_BRANA|nr:hypothetical protein HID58_002770 [Brassica napus]
MNNRTGFVNLMYSQSSVDLESPEPAWFVSQGPDEYGFHPVQPSVESSVQPCVESSVQPSSAVGHVNQVTGVFGVAKIPLNVVIFIRRRRTGAMSSFSFDYCFLAEVTASNLEEDKLVSQFISSCGSYEFYSFAQIMPRDDTGEQRGKFRECDESSGKYYITRGWRKFCLDNRCEIGDLFVFNVVVDEKTTPLMCVCPERKECFEILSKYLSRKSGESSLGGDS